MAKFVGDKEWVFGYMTLIDFHICFLSSFLEKIDPELLDKHPWIRKIAKAIVDLPEVQKYFERENSIKDNYPNLPPTSAIKV